MDKAEEVSTLGNLSESTKAVLKYPMLNSVPRKKMSFRAVRQTIEDRGLLFQEPRETFPILLKMFRNCRLALKVLLGVCFFKLKWLTVLRGLMAFQDQVNMSDGYKFEH